MSFRCIIDEKGIKSFAQAINCCCKLGDDIYLDANRDQLTIKVLNEPYKSAFMMISFDSGYFEVYEIEGRFRPNGDPNMTDDSQSQASRTTRDPKVTCKLKTRSCLLAFKKEKSLAKNVKSIEIIVDSSKDYARFIFAYRSKCVKRMDLPLGSDSLDVHDDIFQNGQSKVKCPSKILSDILTYFAKEDEYITMKASPQSIDFETHFVDRDKSGKLTRTNIDSGEFDEYKVNDEIFLTYSLRLIKPFLSFCSNRIPDINIYMEGSNQPICFNAEFPPQTKIALALATLDVNHPTTRNSSRSSVMYQTVRSSQQGETTRVTNNGTRRSRFSSQNSRESPSNSQSSRHSQSNWNRNGDQETVNNRLISNEESHPSEILSNSRRESSRILSTSRGESSRIMPNHSTPRESNDVEMCDEDQIMQGDEAVDDSFPSQSTIGPSQITPLSLSQEYNLDEQLHDEMNSQLSISVSQQPAQITTNGSQTSSMLNKSPSYWMSLEIRPEDELSSDELLVPPTDDEWDSD